MKKIIRITESDLIKIVKRVINENDQFIPNDYDLDISNSSNNGKILYDFWRSDYPKDYVGLSDWLEDNGYGIFDDDDTWISFDKLLYEFWRDHPENDEDEELLSSRFVEWLDENGLEIKPDEWSLTK